MTKIAINGFGRIGRAAFKVAMEKDDLEVVAINDLADIEALAHLLKYDSAYGVYKKEVKVENDKLVVGDKSISYFNEKDPSKLPWDDLGVDVVLECTGVFRKYEDAEKHLQAGANKVVLSAAPKSEGIKVIVMGVNEKEYNPEKDKIISCASCTTNCYAPITKLLHDNFTVERGFMVTAHAVTNDQRVTDLPHKDLRRARSVLGNIIPTTSGSDKATVEVIPELEGKIHAMAMRVPILVGSVIYAIYDLKDNPAPDKVNKLIKQASEGDYKDLIKYETDPIVSSDIVGTTYSAILDSQLTEYSDDLIKLVAWYDNEWAYVHRLIEETIMVGK
jgi:glyceraldehyde 3-phosphate dehydrogenase